MQRMRRLSAAALVAAVAVVSVTTLPVEAITYGFVDTNNVYASSGAFIVRSPTTGNVYPICSGTLIAPTVFLTASHCSAFFENDLAPLGFTAFVSFDNPIPFGDLTNRRTRLIGVTEVVSNPGYNQSQSDSGDIAVLLVRANDTKGMRPAALPPAGLLDTLAAQNGLQNAVFTAVDSGGPNFFSYQGQRLLAAITITGDAVCRAKWPLARIAASWSSVSTFVARCPSRLSTESTGTLWSAAGRPEAGSA
jgi:hypothetical protein